ncbi:class I SAM-dependent methyltransferase [Kribbella sp. WER1]
MSHVAWGEWLARWDRQQAGYLSDRDEQFELMLDVVERLVGRPDRFVDLACGPGSIAARAVRRFPDADVVGVDLDPFLLEIARNAVPGVRFVEADLRSPGWDNALDDTTDDAVGGVMDAVCSATALHWLGPVELGRVAQVLARRVRSGGVFLNADTMRLGPVDVPRLDAVAVELRNRIWADSHAAGVEDWAGWWDAAAAEPAFGELLAERARRFADRGTSRDITLTDTVEAFGKAGFAEVAVLGQVADKHLFAAIR